MGALASWRASCLLVDFLDGNARPRAWASSACTCLAGLGDSMPRPGSCRPRQLPGRLTSRALPSPRPELLAPLPSDRPSLYPCHQLTDQPISRPDPLPSYVLVFLYFFFKILFKCCILQRFSGFLLHGATSTLHGATFFVASCNVHLLHPATFSYLRCILQRKTSRYATKNVASCNVLLFDCNISLQNVPSVSALAAMLDGSLLVGRLEGSSPPL